MAFTSTAHLVPLLVILMTLLEEHQYFMQRSFFHAFLLIEDLAGFKLLNSPFRCATLCVCLVSLRISRLSDSLCDRKRATSDWCEWRIISHLSGAESVSPSEPGTVWVNTEQMVWSLSKTNTPLVLVFSLQTEKTRPSVMCDSFSLRLHTLLLQKNWVAASCDLIHICHHLASVFIPVLFVYSFSASNRLPSLYMSSVVPLPLFITGP